MRKNLKRNLLMIALTGMMAITLVGCGAKKNTDKKAAGKNSVPAVVNIGVQTLITPELVTRYEKSYEQYLGTKVNIIQFDSGADVNKAFSSGSIDIGAVGTSPASLGIINDLGYEVFWYHDVIGSAESLVATNQSKAESLKDLKGKKVATPFASTAHYSLLNALSLAGVKPSEVELLDMQPNNIYAAWKRGDIDAAYVWNPVLGKIKENGKVLTDSSEMAKKGIVTADLAAVRKEFAKKYPEVVVSYVKAQLHALDVFEKDNQKALEAIAETAGISKEDAKQQVQDFTYPSGKEQIGKDYLGTKEKKGNLVQTLKNTADFLVEQGTIDKAPGLNAFEESVTGEFVEKALNSK